MQESYIVRYGQMRYLGEFQGLADHVHPRGQRVVVRTDRGTELGEVLCLATERTALFLENPARGDIVRTASTEDLAGESTLVRRQREGFATCSEFIVRRKLQMDLVD